MKLGVIGLGRMGRFRLEQLRLCDGVAAVIGCDPDPQRRELSQELVDRTTADLNEVWSTPGLDAVLITALPGRPFGLVREALGRGLGVAVELPLAAAPTDLASLSPDDHMLVLDRFGVDEELLLARELVASGRLGDVRSVRFVTREFRLPDRPEPISMESDAAADLLETFGEPIFTRLHGLIAPPEHAIGRLLRDAAGRVTGFFALLSDQAGRTAQIEVRTNSLVGERSGWTIEGSDATLCRSRLYSQMPDGEIVDQPLRVDGDREGWCGNRWWQQLHDREACRRSIQAAAWAVAAVAAVRESDQTGATTPISPATG